MPEREIKNRIKRRIDAIPARMPADKESSLRRISLEHLADHPHLRILPVKSVREIPNKRARHVLNRVLADAVEPGHADPPKRVLNFIARNFRLFLIHVRQVVVKPAVQRIAQFFLVGVRRKQQHYSESC